MAKSNWIEGRVDENCLGPTVLTLEVVHWDALMTRHGIRTASGKPELAVTFAIAFTAVSSSTAGPLSLGILSKICGHVSVLDKQMPLTHVYHPSLGMTHGPQASCLSLVTLALPPTMSHSCISPRVIEKYPPF